MSATQRDNVLVEVDFSEGKNRDFGQKRPSAAFPASSDEAILSQFDRIGENVCKKREAEIKKARAIAIKILKKKKVAEAVYYKLIESKIEPRPVLEAVLHVARGLEPGMSATNEVISSLIGTCPDEIAKKYWQEEMPKLLDFIGLTTKKSATERVFTDLYDLQNKCNPMLRCGHVAVDVTEKAVRVPVMACDRFAGKYLRENPYLEVGKNGAMTTYQKPSETPEGKAAKRAADLATYLAKEEARRLKAETSTDDGSHEDNFIDSIMEYKWWFAAGTFAVIALVVLAQMQPLKNAGVMNEVFAPPPSGEFVDRMVEDAGL